MKKTFKKLGFGENAVSTVLLSAITSVLVILAGFGAVALAQNVSSDVTNQGGLKGSPQDLNTIIKAATGKEDLKWGDVFNENPGQNMYFMIHKQLIQDPDKKIYQESAKKLGINETDLRSMMNGDISPILKKNPNLPLEKAFEELEKIRKSHNEKLIIGKLKADLESEVQPSEMFSNGDTSDSGFDLLNDLYRMEKILFDTSKPVDVGGNQLANDTGVAGRAPAASAGNDGNSGANSVAASVIPGGSSSGNANSSGAGASSGNSKTAVDPNVCLVDEDLEKALDTLNAESQTDPRLRNQTATDEGVDNSANDDVDLFGTDDDLLGSSENGAELVAPNAADWENPVFCGDVLCITIDAKMKTVQPVPGSSDCVACHVLSINASMKKLLSKSLLPGKLTGNVGEPAKCKEATAQSFTAIGLNVVAIPSPVKNPGNNNLVVGKPIDQEWQKFTNRYLGDGKTAAATDKSVGTSTQDAVVKKALNDAPSGADLSEVYDKINKQLTNIENDRLKALQNLTDASKIDDANTYFQSLSYELNTMISYFNSMKTLFEGMQVPCKAALEKKYCS